jgi:hypothetical protein
MSKLVAWLLAGAVLAVCGDASAQPVGSNEWWQGTTLSGFVGAAADSDASAAAGGALGWEILPRFTLEGSGTWVAAGPGANAFVALLGARIPLIPAQRFVPFASAAVGVYHAGFDATAHRMPRFYRSRMGSDGFGLQGPRTFDDFVVAVGGGADLFLKRHLALRPDVRVLLVRRNSDTHAVAMAGISLAYHFEEHPITPTR